MKRVYLLILISLFTPFSAQKKDNCEDIINRWNSWDFFNRPSLESVKRCLAKKEKKFPFEELEKTGGIVLEFNTNNDEILHSISSR